MIIEFVRLRKKGSGMNRNLVLVKKCVGSWAVSGQLADAP